MASYRNRYRNLLCSNFHEGYTSPSVTCIAGVGGITHYCPKPECILNCVHSYEHRDREAALNRSVRWSLSFLIGELQRARLLALLVAPLSKNSDRQAAVLEDSKHKTISRPDRLRPLSGCAAGWRRCLPVRSCRFRARSRVARCAVPGVRSVRPAGPSCRSC